MIEKSPLQRILPEQKSFILTFPFLERFDFLNCGMILKTPGDPTKVLLRILNQDPHGSQQNIKLAIPKQNHSSKTLPILDEGDLEFLKKESFDGLLTELGNVFLCAQVADCIPLFAMASEKKMIGLLHVGWRGFVSGIVNDFLSKTEKLYQVPPQDLTMLLGPYIKGCCYEISSGVAALFDRKALFFEKNNIRLDLGEALFRNLKRSGVKKENIFLTPDCTFCHPEHYISFRRERNKSKRMLAFIGISQRS